MPDPILQETPEQANAESARVKRLERVATQAAEEARKDEVDEVLEFHGILVEKLVLASTALEMASTVAEEIQKHLQNRSITARTEDDRAKMRHLRLTLDRMLRVTDVVRTVNAARMHVSRIKRGSVAISKAAGEWTDELVRSDERVFE